MEGTSATWLARLTTKSNRVASNKMRCSASPAPNHAERVDLVVPQHHQAVAEAGLPKPRQPSPAGHIKVANQTLRPKRESVCGIAETGTSSARRRSVVVQACSSA